MPLEKGCDMIPKSFSYTYGRRDGIPFPALFKIVEVMVVIDQGANAGSTAAAELLTSMGSIPNKVVLVPHHLRHSMTQI